MSELHLVIPGLNALDAEELQETLGTHVEIVEPTIPEGALAEPTTLTAVIAISPFLITAIALWMSKGRRRYLRKETFKLVLPNGTCLERTFEVQASSEEEAKAEIAAKLSDWMSSVQHLGGTLG